MVKLVHDLPEPPEPGVLVQYVMVKGDPGEPGINGVDGTDGDDGSDGEPGAVGPSGSGTQYIEITYASPQQIWEHHHGLNRYAVWAKLLDLDRSEKEGYAVTPDENTIRVEWFFPESGILQIFY